MPGIALLPAPAGDLLVEASNRLGVPMQRQRHRDVLLALLMEGAGQEQFVYVRFCHLDEVEAGEHFFLRPSWRARNPMA